MLFFCCSEQRRGAVRKHGTLNGIDYLEVDPTQRVLKVYFIRPPAIALSSVQVAIEGGERITGITLSSPPAYEGQALRVEVNQSGDYSTYTLRIIPAPPQTHASLNLDPLLSAVDFSFKVECKSDLDCLSVSPCAPEPSEQPPLDYLAKDFESFRRLMFDRLALTLPAWRERNLADLGVTLVELFAYAGDHLSYRQDVIATEAYLGTARHRISARRHARLVDYRMHDGRNARVWVAVTGTTAAVVLPKQTPLFTRREGLPRRIAPGSADEAELIASGAECFETLHDLTLDPVLDAVPFHTWGEVECVLPRGATSATLRGELKSLEVGRFLLLEEVIGARTGGAPDADRTRRHVVRLTAVDTTLQDPLGPVHVTRVTWDQTDALPFPLCLSARSASGQLIENVALACGNVVLADHGRRVVGEKLEPVPAADERLALDRQAASRCSTAAPRLLPARYRPRLARTGVTQERKPPAPGVPAALALVPEDPLALPSVLLRDGDGQQWQPEWDLTSATPFARSFVGEVDDRGVMWLRFGDDGNGARPAERTTFVAEYRVGNGARGNIGAESLHHVVSSVASVLGVRNPMSAVGGVEPESIESVRTRAPAAFRRQERAATPDDYARIAQRHREVQRAAARVRFTGGWRTIFLAVDRRGGRRVDENFANDLRAFLESYRMAGEDVEIEGPRFVALDVALKVCVDPSYFRSDVKRALLALFGRVELPGGRRGVFHPDNFSFGQSALLSPLYAAAQAVQGVRSVRFTRFQRRGDDTSSGLSSGELPMGRLEIARMDNDPNFPERGLLQLVLEGGR